MGRSSLWYVTTLTGLVTIVIVIVKFLISHVTSRYHMFKGLSKCHAAKCQHNAILGGHWSSASGDIKCLICHVT